MVGKTTIRLRYMGHGFQKSYLQTLGADFALKDVKMADNKRMSVQIWDLAGQIHYNSLRNNYFIGSHSAFIVFDVTNIESFNNVPKWYELLVNNFPDRIPVVILGNKSDLKDEDDYIPEKKVLNLVKEIRKQNKGKSVHYLETSAKNGENIDVAFDLIIEEVYEAFK